MDLTSFYPNGKLCFINICFDFTNSLNCFCRVNWEESVVNTDETSPSIVVPNNTVQLLNNNSMNQTESEQDAVESKRQTFLMIYTCIMVFGTVFYVGRSFSFFRMCLRISINLHDMIFRSVTRAKMCFFNNNPSGRILNRFAGDINVIDSLLPNNMVGVLDVRIIISFLHTKAIP